MANLTLNRNDYGFDISFTIRNKDGSVFVLTGYDIAFHLSDRKYVNKLRGTCIIVGALAGTCKYPVVEGDLNLPVAPYLGEIQVTKPGTQVLSNVSKIPIKIVEECG